jgi:long-chain-fatty-acyl-CoA reductase
MAAYPQEKCRGRVIHYGPRLGVGVVLSGFRAEDALPALAWDVALWEQRACSSPRVLFVEGAGDLPRRVAEGLNAELARVRTELPPRPLSLDEKAEVLSFREMAWWSGTASVFAPDGSMSHTVLQVPQLPADIPLGARTVLVIPIRGAGDLPDVLRPLREYLQTAVLAAPSAKWQHGVDLLVRSGCTQVTAPGASSARVVGLPHEGEFALRRLVKLVGVDLGIGPLACPNRDPTALATVGAALK